MTKTAGAPEEKHSEDYVVVTAMDQPTPAFPGVPKTKPAPKPAAAAEGDDLNMY